MNMRLHSFIDQSDCEVPEAELTIYVSSETLLENGVLRRPLSQAPRQRSL